jgi:endonuclease/exonuclease/phosphatase family metal-dependent hydrolase
VQSLRSGYNPPVEITVVTYNIYNEPVSFEPRYPLVLETLRATKADVVALQEVPTRQEVTRRLAGALGYADWAEVVFVRPDDGWTEGLAVLSRFPVLEQEDIDLRPGVPNCLRARLEAPEGPVDVFNAHFHPRDANLRASEISIVLDAVAASDAPVILCGDFNGLPEEFASLNGFSSLRAAYELVHGRYPESTFPTPYRKDARRYGPIDYILVRPDQLSASEARLIGDAPSKEDESLWPSDHYGVLARLVSADGK